MSTLLKPFGVLWGTSRVDSNSIDTSGYALEDRCQNSLTIFMVFLASEFTISLPQCRLLASAED